MNRVILRGLTISAVLLGSGLQIVPCLPIASSALAQTPVAAQSQVLIPEPEFDFGTVTQGSKVVHDFVVKNVGTADLTIQRVIPACGCTATSSTQSAIAPGQQGLVHVEFDTAGFSGEKLKTVRIYTSDLDTPSSVLTLKGIVEPDIVVEPKRVAFEQVVRGKLPAASREVSIKIRPDSKSAITDVRVVSPMIVVEELVSNSKERKLRITIDPKAPVGELRERIVVAISGQRESSINIPIFAVVTGDLQLEPSSLSFGILEGAQPIDRSVKLLNVGASKISVLSVNSDNPAITVQVKPIEAGKIFVLQVQVDPTKVMRDLRASVSIVTDSKENASLTLGVYGILPPKN